MFLHLNEPANITYRIAPLLHAKYHRCDFELFSSTLEIKYTTQLFGKHTASVLK